MNEPQLYGRHLNLILGTNYEPDELIEVRYRGFDFYDKEFKIEVTTDHNIKIYGIDIDFRRLFADLTHLASMDKKFGWTKARETYMIEVLGEEYEDSDIETLEEAYKALMEEDD